MDWAEARVGLVSSVVWFDDAAVLVSSVVWLDDAAVSETDEQEVLHRSRFLPAAPVPDLLSVAFAPLPVEAVASWSPSSLQL